MNGSFTQAQQIDCTCFDFRGRQQTFTRNQSNILKPLTALRSPNISTHAHPKISLKQHTNFKKSFTKKRLNESAKQTYSNGFDTGQKLMRHESTNTDWTGELKEYNRCVQKFEKNSYKKEKKSQETQIRNIRESKHSKTQIESIWGKQNREEKLKKLNQISVPTLKMNMDDNLNFSCNATVKQQKPQKNRIIMLKQNLRPSFTNNMAYVQDKISHKYIDPSEIDSQEKTIKKRHSVLTSFYNIRQIYTKHNLQSAKILQLDSTQNMKRGSIRGENNINFIRQLQNIYPKEIESFDQENISGTESEVIQKGRYTWAPDGNNRKEDFHFISSLHINTNRTSNRPSKMISGDI